MSQYIDRRRMSTDRRIRIEEKLGRGRGREEERGREYQNEEVGGRTEELRGG
jgi:hypothetical protein